MYGLNTNAQPCPDKILACFRGPRRTGVPFLERKGTEKNFYGNFVSLWS